MPTLCLIGGLLRAGQIRRAGGLQIRHRMRELGVHRLPLLGVEIAPVHDVSNRVLVIVGLHPLEARAYRAIHLSALLEKDVDGGVVYGLGLAEMNKQTDARLMPVPSILESPLASAG